jgi:ABC-type nitrate/sulfonate/bicarbonate transport system permease component
LTACGGSNVSVVAGLSRLPPRLRIRPAVWRGALSLLSAAVLWELVARYLIKSPLFFAPLSAVMAAMIRMWSEGTLQQDIIVSLQTFVVGFVAGSIAAIVIGVIMASSEWLRDFLDPWISAMYATPFIALAPLFTLWFGIGLLAHSAVVFVVVFFPVLINTFAGLTTTDAVLIEVIRSFNASNAQVFSKVRFPAALPFIVTGLRLGVARGLVGVVVAEMFGSSAGLGFRILVAGQAFDTASLFVGILLLALAGVIGVELLKYVERQLAPWRFQEMRQ